ncbi:alkaline phosphatase family protein [Streptomyces anulatus]
MTNTSPLLDPFDAPVPAYGSATLSDLLPAVAAGFDLPPSALLPTTRLLLPPADRVCVFLIDGLGSEQLRQHKAYAPFLASLPDQRPTMNAGFPSTTAASLASFGTGLPAGRHGLAGYSVAVPGKNVLMNQIRWEPWTEPTLWQPHPTVFQLLHEAGIEAAQVLPSRFATTGLTRIAVSGGRFFGDDDADRRMDRAAALLAAADRALVYTYLSDLDAAGHRYGVDSEEWRGELMRADRLAERLANSLPPRSALYVTADHGMVDISQEDHVDFDHDWELRTGVSLLGGEGRARHVYTAPGAAADVLAVWTEVLGDRMWVASRQQAVDAGWFGPHVEDRVMGRLGDVIAVAHDDIAIVATEAEPGASSMIGLHGAMTPAEQSIPLLHLLGP